MKIGCIGVGNMATAIMKQVSLVEGTELYLATRTPNKIQLLAEELSAHIVSNEVCIQEADIIFLGVKPQQLANVLHDLNPLLKNSGHKLFISMAAGIQVEQLQSLIGAEHSIIRMMPNTPVEIGEGVTTYTGTASKNEKEQFLLLMKHTGLCMELEESIIDAATGVAGCGPAFVYLFIEALSNAGVSNGLSQEIALQLATQTVKGAADLVQQTRKHPAVLKEEVCSPAGSTIAGVVSLETNGFRSSVIHAVNTAVLKTKELGK